MFLHTIYLCITCSNLFIFASYFDPKKNIFGKHFTSNAGFRIWVRVKKAFLRLVTLKKNILPKQFCRTKINFRSMPISSDLGKLRPTLMTGWILDSRIGPFEVKVLNFFLIKLILFRKQTGLVWFGASLYVGWIWSLMELF